MATGLEQDVPSQIHCFSLQADSDPTRQREVKQRLRKAWKLRNRTVHTASSLNPVDVNFLIETIRELLPECS